MNCNLSCTSSKLQLIAHPTRLKILCQLGQHELSVQEIVHKAGSSQSNISQHLIHMREKGILESRRDANRVYYRIGDVKLLGVIQQMREIYCSNDS
ncbi:MAG: metalloregulator ArsR/SmtB family transcription factor [Gammaproteobacteria bacterium]|nr:metalloregulator ArsR/SmtB family transcription factor [Gammaproteobacteria bacterium]